MRVYEFMAENAQRIIDSISSETFSSRDFIWKLMSDYETDYIRMLNEQTCEHPIHEVHKQIGRYLADNAVSLEIQASGTKEGSIDPFGKISATEIWLKNIKK